MGISPISHRIQESAQASKIATNPGLSSNSGTKFNSRTWPPSIRIRSMIVVCSPNMPLFFFSFSLHQNIRPWPRLHYLLVRYIPKKRPCPVSWGWRMIINCHPAKWQDVQDPHSRNDAQNGRDRLGGAVQRALASEWLSFTPGRTGIEFVLMLLFILPS